LDQFLRGNSIDNMAIVASGYLFSDETAFHVDVFQGDTPYGLIERHCPGSIIKSAAVLDVDVPGQTVPVAIEGDEPVVVVGSSPRTSVFVYAEGPESSERGCSDSEGEPSSPLPPPALPHTALPPSPPASPPPLANTQEVASNVEQIADLVVPEEPKQEQNDGGAEVETSMEDDLSTQEEVVSTQDDNEQVSDEVGEQEVKDVGVEQGDAEVKPPSPSDRFHKTRRVKKLRANRGTRRATKPIQLELI
jgi:hypothetical protein